jgi:O-acetyl-ADP-ribose deacetylase (regulator of RNase III)
MAADRMLRRIAFPSISTGAYGFPVERASRIAVATASAFVSARSSLIEIRFVTFSRDDYAVYALLLNRDGTHANHT